MAIASNKASPTSLTRRLLRFFSRIWIRLLAFNILLVFVPALGLPFFELYEQKLLDLQERSMVQQGRLLAAALGEQGDVDPARAQAVLVNLRQEVEARLRVVDAQSRLLADSSRLGPRSQATASEAQQQDIREGLLYRLGSFLYGLYERFFLPPEPPLPEREFYATATRLEGPEIQQALRGDYGSATRASPGGERSLTLYSALPIRSGEAVVGAVLVSRSTFQILQALVDFRLLAFRVTLSAMLASILLSLLLATTIARPVSRLRQQAQALLDRRGRLLGHLRPSRSLDEIGDLSRALSELTRRLEGHLRFTESFASDVSHELKNPLAAIRNATELLAEVEEPAQRQRFMELVQREVARLERLLADVRDIARLDVELEEEVTDSVALGPLLETVAQRCAERWGLPVRVHGSEQDLRVRSSAERLSRIFANLMDNAASFSPPGAEVVVRLHSAPQCVRVTVQDQGPGLPPEHLERVFERFFSYRPDEQRSREKHSGLGLAIVRTLVEHAGGSVRASNAEHGGACFLVELPALG